MNLADSFVPPLKVRKDCRNEGLDWKKGSLCGCKQFLRQHALFVLGKLLKLKDCKFANNIMQGRNAMSLVIKGGRLITTEMDFAGDVLCEGETIARIDRDIAPPPGAEVIDATGKFVFPGFIDPHTHIYLPFMGTYSRDTYETASQAALVGGTIITFDTPPTKPTGAKSFVESYPGLA